MSSRSISDFEIALIKAMLNRGMANKNIQFYFNRPDRAVNSGRITEIGENSYSNSADISAASDVELDEFLASQNLDGALASYNEKEKLEIGEVSNREFSDLRELLEGYVGNDVAATGNETQVPISDRELKVIRLSLDIAVNTVNQPQWSIGTIYHFRGLQAVLIEFKHTLQEAAKIVGTLLPLAKMLAGLIDKIQGILEAIKPKDGTEEVGEAPPE